MRDGAVANLHTLPARARSFAGPGGATPDKPVGLTWVALCAPSFERAERYVWTGDRVANKEASAEAALHLVLDYLEQTSPR